MLAIHCLPSGRTFLLQDNPETRSLIAEAIKERETKASTFPASDKLDGLIESGEPRIGLVECTASFLYQQEW